MPLTCLPHLLLQFLNLICGFKGAEYMNRDRSRKKTVEGEDGIIFYMFLLLDGSPFKRTEISHINYG